MNDQFDAPSTEKKLALLNEVVRAKLNYWRAMTALECALTENTEFTDKANDAIHDAVESIASVVDYEVGVTACDLAAIELLAKDPT